MSEISISLGSDLSRYSLDELRVWADRNRSMNVGESADYIIWQSVGSYIALMETLEGKAKKIENPLVGQAYKVVKT